ncbi:large ribosomal subunit protein eL20z-like isoform X2 [Miscanthus floridulus]|uniref:large ribosomal subunit protein eL20z-like isoform X2 n=1 Tax=Miscanthus floridulus TaxID=154761 RepID=UPI0034585433
MQEAKHPTTTKLPSQSQTSSPSPSPSPSPSAPAANPLRYHHGYGTFPQPFQSSTPPVAGAAAYHDYHASPIGLGGQGFVAFPCAVKQQVFVEGVPVREPPLPFCGVGVGWFLFLLGFFLAAIPWYAGAFLLFFVALDHREKPGLIACTVAGIFALVAFILNGIRLHPFW